MVGALLFALAWLLPPLLITPPPLHAQQQPRKIVIAGAQSLTPLAEQFSNQFRKEHPKVEIEIRGGGSNYAVNAARRGEIQIGLITRSLSAAEKADLHVKSIGQDVIVLMSYPGNPVRNLTLEQLRRAYSGKATNWRELGGEEKGIVPLTREPGSAIHATFNDRLFGKGSEGREKAFTIRASKEKILKTIKRIAGCIGYGIVRPEEAHSQGIRVLAVEGRVPTADNIGDGLYPFTRPQLLIARQEPHPLVREWMVSFAAFVKRSSAP